MRISDWSSDVCSSDHTKTVTTNTTVAAGDRAPPIVDGKTVAADAHAAGTTTSTITIKTMKTTNTTGTTATAGDLVVIAIGNPTTCKQQAATSLPTTTTTTTTEPTITTLAADDGTVVGTSRP